MDRRTALAGLIGLAGAGVSLRWAQRGTSGNDSEAPVGAAAQAPPARRETGSGGFASVSVGQVPLGGGGFITGIDISRDGQRFVCRTDVCNAYVRDARDAAWRPLFSPTTMRREDYDPLPDLTTKADGQGVAAVRIAPSNHDVIIASYYGFVWRSVDGGRSIRRTALPQKAMPSNTGVQRLFNRIVDVHPTNPDRVIVGTYGDGVWHSADGGQRWDRVSVPATGQSRDGKPGINLVLFDPIAPDRVYVFVTGVGLHRSDNGAGGTFRLLGGGPRLCSNLVAGPDGTMLLCEHTPDNSGRLWRYLPTGTWASAKPEHEAFVVAVNPANPAQVVAANPNGFMMMSDDRGASFRSIGGVGWSARGGEVGWTGRLTTMFPAEMRFDPASAARLWIAQGVGVAQTKAAAGRFTLTDWSAGIEELCALAAVSVPGGKTFLTAWDKPFWRIDTATTYANDFRYPVVAGKRHDPNLVAFASYLDYAADDPRFLVGVVAPSADAAPGYTSDGGDSWHAFEGTPASGWGYGGCIAASTKANIVLLPSNNGVGVYTRDGGKNWSPIRLDGTTPTGGFANAYYVARKNISADKSRPGTFALVYTVIKNNEFGEPLGGVWVTRDGGASWTQMLAGVVSQGDHRPAAAGAGGQDNRQFWQCQLDYVPGRSGELVYTPHADYSGDRLWWSRDDGKSWQELDPAIRNVTSFGFGKAAPGQARPTLFFWGEVKKVPGLYVSLDWFATAPRLLTRFPSQMLAKVSHVSGDPNRYGRAYVGTSCAGWVQVDFS